MNISLNDKNHKEQRITFTNYDLNQITTLGNNEKYRTIKETIIQQRHFVNDVIKKNKAAIESLDKLIKEAKSLQDEVKENQYETQSTSNETYKHNLSNGVNALLNIEKEINNELKLLKESQKSLPVNKKENQLFDNKDKCIFI